ncbi:MAG: MarR family transcriptional regulator [Pseudolabrys sp.]|nr:MarR family transcriptional regulator [Pseudolabrys sp.]
MPGASTDNSGAAANSTSDNVELASANSPFAHVNFRSASEISNHPRFQQAHDCLVDGLASLYGNDRRTVRSLTEFVPAVSFMVIICLDANYDPEQPATFVTLSLLRSMLKMMGITDGRRVAGIVNGLEMDGYLTRELVPNDRRAYHLRPTEKMLATDREWIAVFHAPLALLYPEDPVFRAAVARDPAYQKAYRRISLSTLSFANKITRDNPVISFFLAHSVGIRILMVLALMVRGRTPPRTPAGFYTATAKITSVSRTHVSNLMQEAANRGLVTLSNPPGRFVEMKPVLEQALAQWISDALSGIDLVATIAKDQLKPAG